MLSVVMWVTISWSEKKLDDGATKFRDRVRAIGLVYDLEIVMIFVTQMTDRLFTGCYKSDKTRPDVVVLRIALKW